MTHRYRVENSNDTTIVELKIHRINEKYSFQPIDIKFSFYILKYLHSRLVGKTETGMRTEDNYVCNNKYASLYLNFFQATVL